MRHKALRDEVIKVQPISEVLSTGWDDERSIGAFAREACDFLVSQRWCGHVTKGFVAKAWEGVLDVFYFEFVPTSPDADADVWVVTGDVPPAYLCNDNRNWREALEGYCSEMQRWVHAVQRGQSVGELIPVNAPATPEYAELLDRRLTFIRDRLLD